MWATGARAPFPCTGECLGRSWGWYLDASGALERKQSTALGAAAGRELVFNTTHDLLRTPGAAIAMDGGVADTACYTQADHEWAEGTDSANRAAVTC